jgi:hypothetical protein
MAWSFVTALPFDLPHQEIGMHGNGLVMVWDVGGRIAFVIVRR